MSFLSNPVVMCSLIAVGIVFILVLVVVICCKNSADKEREELMALSEEIEAETIEDVSVTQDDKIESVLSKMQEAMDLKEETTISFEEEQEENAIISYQELLNSLGSSGSIDIDAIELYEDELDDQIEISDFNKEIIEAYQNENLNREIYRFQNDYSSQAMPTEVAIDNAPVMNFSDSVLETEEVLEVSNVQVPNEVVYEAKHVVGSHKFKKSDFISPVYGIIEEPVVEKVEEIEEIIFDDEII